MSASGGLSQMLKGIIIGVVLIMAIIGTMSLLDEEDNPLSSFMTKDKAQSSSQATKEIVAPSITLNPDDSQENLNIDNNTNIGDLNAEIVEQKNTTLVNSEETQNNQQVDNAPTLEDERSTEEATTSQVTPVEYGMMALKSINSTNGQAIKANYTVFDKNNVKVAESRDANNSSYRLPSGQYKVETTLTKIDEATNQTVPVLTKSRYIIVRKNSTTNQTFELEPPASTGVLQVSAKMNNQIIRANYVIQKSTGEVIASRNNVTNSLFKLNTGSYKVTVSSGNNKDFRSIEIKAGESTQTVFDLKEAASQGKLIVRVFDTNTSNPVRADIVITAANGTIIQDLKSSTQTELTLAAGDYKISVKGPNGTSNKNIRIASGQALNEIFRFEAPNSNTSQSQATTDNSTQINENVTIKPVETQTNTPAIPVIDTNVDAVQNKVTLRVSSQDLQTRKPMKSNIYIQTLSGKHLDKRTYVDSANFNLDPGTYKVTVRATNRKNTVKTIRISKDTNLNEVFLLAKPNTQTTQTNTTQAAIPQVNSTRQVNPTNPIATGFLNVSMQSPNNQRSNLKSHFIVSTVAGEKIVELTSVAVGNFKLDVGSYSVTAIHNGKRKTQRVNVRSNQNTRLAFNITDFQAAKGVLRSRIVDETGRPLKGNLSVTNLAGQIVARANNVSSANFNLPPTRHTVNVFFQGLSGKEVVNISANETTVQTFTIAPDRNNRQNNSRDIKELLKEKLEKEIRKQF